MPLTRNEVVLIKAESTYGSDPTHADTDATLVENFQWRFVSEKYARAILSASPVPRRPSYVGQRFVEIEWDQEMSGYSTDYGAGVAFPKYDAPLRSAGFTRTDDAGDPRQYTYYQSRSAFGSCAIEYEADGVVAIALGCMGDVTFPLIPGRRAMMHYTMMGLFTIPADRALSTPDYTGDIDPPLVAATAFQPWSENPIAGVFGHVRDVTINVRNKVVLRGSQTVGAEGVAAFANVGLGETNDPGSQVLVKVERKANPTGDDYWTRENRAVRTRSGSVSFTLGSAAGNTHTITLNDLVIEPGSTQFEDEDGIAVHTLDCRVLGETTVPAAASEDGITIVAT
tara:strand:+ start:1338 stop:2357 length:1020 start_codon:yes stop_codon:yes gene_type:complete